MRQEHRQTLIYLMADSREQESLLVTAIIFEDLEYYKDETQSTVLEFPVGIK